MSRWPESPAEVRSVSTQHRAEHREELQRRDRFGQVGLGALIQTADSIVDLDCCTGDVDHRNVAVAKVELPAHFEAIDVRQGHVEDYSVKSRDGSELERLLPTSRLDCLHTGMAK